MPRSMGRSPLHHACEKNGNLAMVKYLVEKDILMYLIEERKCSPECPGHWGRSPLHNACQKNGNLAMVKYLVEKHGCDPAGKDDDGDTPLNVAAFSGSLDILMYLIDEKKSNAQVVDYHYIMHVKRMGI